MLEFLKTKKQKTDNLLLNMIRDREFSGAPISLLGNSATKKSQFIANILAPLAAEAGRSFSVLRESEGLLLAECIKERTDHGLSILSASLQVNGELNEYLANIVAKESASKPTHIIIRYPDDKDHFYNQTQSEVDFITSCISAFTRSISSNIDSSIDSDTFNADVIKHKQGNNKCVPVYFGDMERYLLNDDFLKYLMVSSTQIRTLGYQVFFNQVISDTSELGGKLWEISNANTSCQIIIESDFEKAQIIAQELNRYVDARFNDEADIFSNSRLTDVSCTTSLSVYRKRNKEPSFGIVQLR